MNCISKWLIKRRIKQSFQRSNSFGRNFILKTILETMENTYTEDNWPNRMGILVEWILENDANFRDIARNAPNDSFAVMAKAVFSDSVEKSYHRAKK